MTEFSIVIPAYNCEATIKDSIASALRQTFSDLEVIVVDDASTDGTYAAAQEMEKIDSRVKVVRLTQNVKAASARKRGVAHSCGRYVLFLDADDAIVPAACGELHKEFERKPVDILHFGVKVNSPSKASCESAEDFLKPFLGEIAGKGEIFEACFVDGKYKWNLVNKAFNGDLCRRCFGDLPERFVQRGEDLLAFVLLSYHAESYRGLDAKYYVYNFGSGQDGDKIVTLDDFASLCDSCIAAEAIEDLLASWNAPEKWKRGFRGIKSSLIGNCVHKLRFFVSDQDKPEAIRILLRKWGAQESIAALAREYWVDQGQLARVVKPLLVDHPTCKPVKHIATYYYAYQGGGAEGVLRELVRLWQDLGYEVTLFLDEKPTGEVSLIKGVDIVILPKTTNTTPENYLERSQVFAREIKARKIDTVVYQTWLNHLMLWDALTIKAAKANFIIHCHGLFTNKMRLCKKYFSQMPYVYTLADGVVSLSETDKRFWLHFNSNVFVTENPLSLDPQKVKPCECLDKRVLWLGRISPEKHPEDALRIFEVIHSLDPDVRFSLVGGATTQEYEDKIIAMAEELGLSEVIDMPGWCDAGGKIEAFQNARVFLMTSEATEGYPLTLAESKVAGVPCVMYDLPYLTMLEDARGIVTVPQGSVAFAAHAALQLLEDDQYYQEMSAQARSSIRTVLEFDFKAFWQEVFRSAEKGLEEVVDPDALLWDSLFEAYSAGVDSIWASRNWWEGQAGLKDRRISQLEAEVSRIKKANSWRIGRAVTYIPRKTKKFMKRKRN
ncbi:hypothetical protein C1879_10855 [Paraeggerthella hongkongensis]|uniref:glycosyltransferase n=1 Tax=Paraeggerthella sp. TaxID=2897350 RepID=UPI000DF85650|nr:hypothetical protein C1879_10855 [Paraeggerthella hongkongensis]